MTRNARAFLAANAQSPVVYGSVKGRGGAGCIYRLADDTLFDLSALDCHYIGHPRWAHMADDVEAAA